MQILKKDFLNRCGQSVHVRNTDQLLNNISIHIRHENARDMQRKKFNITIQKALADINRWHTGHHVTGYAFCERFGSKLS